MDRRVGSIELQAEQTSALNPILILILVPLMDRMVYPFLSRHGVRLEPLHRMAAGMLLAAASFLLLGFVQLFIDSAEPNSVSVFSQVPQYAVITVAEVLVSVTGLEFAYSQAPMSMKSLVSALSLLTTAVGDLLISVVTLAFSWASSSDRFFIFASLMVLNFILFKWVSRSFVYSEWAAPTAPELHESADDTNRDSAGPDTGDAAPQQRRPRLGPTRRPAG